MREIKFRAWDMKNKHFVSDGCVESTYDNALFIRLSIGHGLIGQMSDDGGKNGLHEHDWDFKADGYDFIVEQFTGLHDKNGREIYEGDIVRAAYYGDIQTKSPSRDVTGCIEMTGGCWEVAFTEERWDDSCGAWRKRLYVKCFTVNHAIEVIGNRWENPELLKSSPPLLAGEGEGNPCH